MVPATMLPAASSLVRSTASLMNTKLPPQKTATLKSSTSATSALRRDVWVIVAGVAILAILSRGTKGRPPAGRAACRAACGRAGTPVRRRRRGPTPSVRAGQRGSRVGLAAPARHELDDENAGEDERRTRAEAPREHVEAEDQPERPGEQPLEPQDHRRPRGARGLLRPGLHEEAIDGAGRCRPQDRHPGLAAEIEAHVLDERRDDDEQHGRRDDLRERQHRRAGARRKEACGRDLRRETEGADQREQVASAHGKASAQAEQAEADGGKHGAADLQPAGKAARHEPVEKRHHDDVEAGDGPALARSRPLQADRLGREGDEEEPSEDGAVHPVAAPCPGDRARHHRGEHERRDEMPHQQVGHGARVGDRVLDDDEVEAPEDRDREQAAICDQGAAARRVAVRAVAVRGDRHGVRRLRRRGRLRRLRRPRRHAVKPPSTR